MSLSAPHLGQLPKTFPALGGKLPGSTWRSPRSIVRRFVFPRNTPTRAQPPVSSPGLQLSSSVQYGFQATESARYGRFRHHSIRASSDNVTGESSPLDAGKLTSAMSAEEFREQAHKMVDFIADYYQTVGNLPVRSQVQPGYLAPLVPPLPPSSPETLEDVLGDVSRVIMPGVTHWQSPTFFAYYPANSSTAGMLGDMLSSALNCIGFSWIASPAATELETLMLDWLGRTLELPGTFLAKESGGKGGGVIQGTASEAVLVALLAARERALRSLSGGSSMHAGGIGGHDDVSNGGTNGGATSASGGADISRLVAFTSDQAHSCVVKACRVAGLGPENLRVIKARRGREYALCAEDLERSVREVQEQGLVPFFICATVGTTSSCAVDPLPEIGRIAQDCGAWFHVDSAYAGSACICPEFRGSLEGIELADSLCINTHKWLLTNFDCSCLWVKDSSLLVNALSSQPEFLRNKASDAQLVVDYKDWQIPLGRRFRSLKLWMVMRLYGTEGLQSHIRRHVALANHFADLVRQDPRFEIVVTPRFALVCFRLKAGSEDEDERRRLNEQLLESINGSGRAFLTHTVLSNTYVIRMAIGSPLTAVEHVDATWQLIQGEAELILQSVQKETSVV